MKNYLLLLAPLFLFINSTGLSQCDSTIISGDWVISSNTTLSGSYYVTGDFTVENNVTVYVEPHSSNSCGSLNVYAQKISIHGAINANGAGYSGGSGGTSSSSVLSATGDAGALTGCSNDGSQGQVEVTGGLKGNDGAGPGAGEQGKDGRTGSGPKQVCGSTNDYFGMIGGSSGASSGGGGSYGGYGEIGGFGGDGANTYSSTNMVISNAYVVNAGYGKTGGNSGATYGTVSQYDISIGSGGGGSGGGGRSYSLGGSGGSGGSGGGAVLLNAYNDSLIVTGTISADGDDGSSGGFGGSGGVGENGSSGCCSDPCNDCGEKTYSCGAGGGGGAGGGSGGGIFMIGNGIHYITGNLYARGGDGGNGGTPGSGTSGCTYNPSILCGGSNQSINTNSGFAGDAGGGGGGGRIKVFASDCFGNIVLPDTDVFGGDGVSFADEGSLHFESTIPCGNANPPPVGVNELFASNKLDFTIYPNPSLEGNVNLKFGSSFVDLSQADLFVFDVFGKQVFSNTLSGGSWLDLNLNLSFLSSGVYLVKINSESYFGEQYFTISK